MIAWAIPKHTKIAKFSDPSRISGPISITRRSLTDCSPNDWNCKFKDPSRIYGQLSFLSDCLAIARRLLGDCLAISRRIAKIAKIAAPRTLFCPIPVARRLLGRATDHQKHSKIATPLTISDQISVPLPLLGDCLLDWCEQEFCNTSHTFWPDFNCSVIAWRLLSRPPNTQKSCKLATPLVFQSNFRLLVDGLAIV